MLVSTWLAGSATSITTVPRTQVCCLSLPTKSALQSGHVGGPCLVLIRTSSHALKQEAWNSWWQGSIITMPIVAALGLQEDDCES